MKQVSPGHSIHFCSHEWKIQINEPFSSLDRLLDRSQYEYLKKCTDKQYIDTLNEEFRNIARNYHRTNRTESSACIISGGIDSSLFSSYLQETAAEGHRTESFVGIFKDKDLSALEAKDLSNKIGIETHYDVFVDEEIYSESLKRCIEIVAAPVHTSILEDFGRFCGSEGT